MRNFRTIAEERDSSEYGLTVDGEALKLSISKAKHHNLMELTFSGSRLLPSLPSVESLKDEYQEDDWDNIEKMYKKFTEKRSEEIEKIVKKFETDLNNVVIEMQKEMGKL